MKSSNVQTIVIAAASIVASAGLAQSSETHRDLAPTPPMGWNSWDIFGTEINEQQAREQADAMAEKLLPAGYDVFTVDIQWYQPTASGHDYEAGAELAMDEHSRLIPAVNRFPSAADGAGFKPLADYVHSKGLRFGIHLMRGIPKQAVHRDTAVLGTDATAADIADTNSTCSWNPDMYGVDMTKSGAQAYYNSLFQMYAEWGVDYVKVDDISRPYDDVQRLEIEAIRKAIDNSGRPMVLSLSPGATPLEAAEHVADHANLWRITDDFWDRWEPLYDMFERLHNWTPHRQQGAWPDADMLPFGVVDFGRETRFTQDEARTCMTLWSIARSPLIFGGDMTKLDGFTTNLLTNQEVLEVNQNSENGRQIARDDGLIAWAADVPDSDDKYVALFNTRDARSYDIGAAVYESEVIRGEAGETMADINVDLKGAKTLILVVTDGGDDFHFDHAAWFEPTLHSSIGTLSLTKLRWEHGTVGWGDSPRVNRTVEDQPLTVGAGPFEGIGTHSTSIIEFEVPEGYDRFTARGTLLPHPAGEGSVQFLVLTDAGKGASGETATVSVPLDALGFSGPVRVRDLWSQQDLGEADGEISAEVPSHGATLLRLSPGE